MKARSAAAQAKRETNPNMAAMARRNARAYYQMAREAEA
jgi:hypothetical protein